MKERANYVIVYTFITAWVAGIFYLMSFSRHEDIFRGISIGLGLIIVVLILRVIYLRRK
jgi:hypothetical protein